MSRRKKKRQKGNVGNGNRIGNGDRTTLNRGTNASLNF